MVIQRENYSTARQFVCEETRRALQNIEIDCGAQGRIKQTVLAENLISLTTVEVANVRLLPFPDRGATLQ